MAATLAAPASVDGKVCDCVSLAVIDTVQRLCGAEPILLDPSPEHGDQQEVIGIISFVGPISWTLSWGFGESTAVEFARVFTGMEFEFSSPDMGDVAAELVNVLAGDVVAQANRGGMQVQMSLPTVARGRAVEFMVERGGPSHRLYFRSAAGDFWIWICVRSQMNGVKMPGRRD